MYSRRVSNRLLILSCLCILFDILGTQVLSQTINDPVGDIPVGDPDYLDIKKIKFQQAGDKINIDFYPNNTIPEGNQVGINEPTVFEVYMDIDNDYDTGVQIENIGVDYKIRVDLNGWNGKSWIDGNVYWNFDDYGSPQEQDGFFVYAENLISWRFRWEFSLVSLNFSEIRWFAKISYNSHLCDQIPDTGHGLLTIDTSVVANIDTVSGEFIEFIYPTSFQDILDEYEVVDAVDAGAVVEGQVCGTQFSDILTIQFNPWLQGVAYCGNPVMMGSWAWNGPPWFVVLHELGHNFTLASVRFRALYPARGYISMGGDDWNFGMNFVEAWATMVGLYAMHDLFAVDSSSQLGNTCKLDLERVFDQTKASYIQKLNNYEQDPDCSILYPDLLDGIFLTLADSHGYEIIPKFFKILQPPDEQWDLLENINVDTDYEWSKTISMTVTCCAFSNAAGVDLRDEFRSRWDFHISDSLYAEIEYEIQSIIVGIEDYDYESPDGDFHVIANYPNPFNSTTTIQYQLKNTSEVNIKLFDLAGKLITEINEGIKVPGFYSFRWKASDISSGIYFCLIETNYGSDRIKMILLK